MYIFIRYRSRQKTLPHQLSLLSGLLIALADSLFVLLMTSIFTFLALLDSFGF